MCALHSWASTFNSLPSRCEFLFFKAVKMEKRDSCVGPFAVFTPESRPFCSLAGHGNKSSSR